jgi:hypothetical protein
MSVTMEQTASATDMAQTATAIEIEARGSCYHLNRTTGHPGAGDSGASAGMDAKGSLTVC